MDRHNSSGRPENVQYTGAGGFEFDRPAPTGPPKRLQRISRAPQSQPQQQPQPQQPQYHHYQQQPQQQQQQHQQQMQYQQQQNQMQHQMQQERTSYSYETAYPQTAHSDNGDVSSRPTTAPHYQRAHTSAGIVRTNNHHYHAGPPPTGSLPPRQMPMPMPPVPANYPSAMVVGGGMPATSRIIPSPALINAVASSGINRQQREQDLANALGRRRPTQGSMSSNGSADHYQSSPAMVPLQPEIMFNGNTCMEYGTSSATGIAQGRYRTAATVPTQSMSDIRVGRSASNASSSSGGYHTGYAASPYATQRRPLQATPEQGQPGYQTANSLMGSFNRTMHQAYPGSRSAPDLNMSEMKEAIGSVAHNADHIPVPQIPTAYSNNAILQQHNLHHQSQPLASAHVGPRISTLSINTDISHLGSPAADYSQGTGQNTETAADSSALVQPSGVATGKESLADTRPQTASSRLAQRMNLGSDTPATGSESPGRPAVAPVNTELAALLENVKPVYPAMLSLVAKSFYELMSQVLQTRVLNGLEHQDCFTGRDAVDTIYAIIRAADRNLAIVVGRALEQQKLFHDVFYDKRLRDDAYELYVFDDDIVRTLVQPDGSTNMSVSASTGDDDDDEYDDPLTLSQAPAPVSAINGVFVMLTDCYSPTCSSSQPCYSVTCPRQRSQQDHLRKTAKNNVATEMKQEKLWSMSVPTEIVKSVSRQELDKQERMYEVFYGEKDYVRDLCILRDLYMKPLHNSDIVNENDRKKFITKVFKNALAILAENMELQRALEKRQKENFICYQVGDVFLTFVERLEAYLEYCANQPYSMHFLDAEKRSNSKLVDFLDKTDRRPECRKLGVQHFLTRPPTRLARYPLVLKAVLKYTPAGHPDRETIPYVVERIEAMLNRINTETGKAQNRLRLYKVDEKLMCTVSDRNDLCLIDEQRKLVRDSQLRKRGGNDSSVIQVLLLDHMLLMCKVKTDSRTGEEKYTIYKHPIPLQLLTICYPDDPSSMRPRMAARRDSSANQPQGGVGSLATTLGTVSTAAGNKLAAATATAGGTVSAGGNGSGAAAHPRPTIISIDHSDSQRDKYTHGLQITHLGRRGFTVTLYANKLADRQQWHQCIEQQQLELMERNRKFELVPVACQFPAGIRVNTADAYDQGRCVVIGTDRGLYVGVVGKPRSFQLLSHLRHDRVFQIEIHERLNVLAMIADKDRNLYVYPLDQLMASTPNSKHGAKIKALHSHVSFFRFGQYQDLDILCSVKSTTLSNQTIIHVYKPVMSNQKSRSLGRFLSLGGESTADSWKCIKECYIAAESTSLHFLRSRLCVGCSRGFEIVDLATMNTQSLLDPADTSLGFINRRDTSHPIALFRVHDGQFLLCYDEFAFYVNRNGQRAQSNWRINWVGTPTSFKFEYPYILAFDSQFIEVYHVETGIMVQVIITGYCTSLSPNKPNVNLCVTSPSPTQSQEVLRIQHLLAKDPL